MKRVKLFALLLPVIFFFSVFVPSVSAATETFGILKDTYANSVYNPPLDYRNNNYGGAGTVVVSNEPIDRLGYLQFEDVSLPESAILDQATLKFYVYSSSGTAKLNTGPVTEDWGENSLTWNNKPTVDQSQASEATISLSEGWKTVSVTNLVNQWLEGSLDNKGIFIYPYGFLYATPENDFALSIRSKEHGSNIPVLEVEYHFAPTPTPTPTPESSPEVDLEGEVTPTEEANLIVQEEASPTPEVEGENFVLNLTRGQAIIGGFILFALVATVVTFAVYSQRKPKDKPKKEEKDKPQEKEKQEEEEED